MPSHAHSKYMLTDLNMFQGYTNLLPNREEEKSANCKHFHYAGRGMKEALLTHFHCSRLSEQLQL